MRTEKPNMSITHNKDTRSPELQADIIEPILLSCVNKISFYVLALAIQRIMPISFWELKRYLFYLIDYGLISYNGRKQIFTIEDGGCGLLSMIDKEKRQRKNNIKDIMITFECKGYVDK
jgi:hypothetical protein